MRVLFVCNQGRHRSKTAAEMFSNRFETDYAGLYSEQKPLTLTLVEWADLIVVMEDEQRIELSRRFPKQYLKKRILSLGVSDEYGYDSHELKDELQKKLNTALEC